MKILIVIILVAIAGYFGYRYFGKIKSSESPAPTAEVEAEPVPPEVVVTEPKSATPTNLIVAKTAPMTNKTAATTPDPNAEWKMKLDGILAGNASPEQKIQQLRELLAKLPEAEAEQAVQALTLMVKNESFGFIKPLVVDPNLPEPVRDEFMVDLMNRPNSIKIPLFLELARNPDHPDHENAYETLEIFTGLKFGADWSAWEKGIEGWLKENPDRVRKPKAPAEAN